MFVEHEFYTGLSDVNLNRELMNRQIVKKITATMFTIAHQNLLLISILSPYSFSSILMISKGQ